MEIPGRLRMESNGYRYSCFRHSSKSRFQPEYTIETSPLRATVSFLPLPQRQSGRIAFQTWLLKNVL